MSALTKLRPSLRPRQVGKTKDHAHRRYPWLRTPMQRSHTVQVQAPSPEPLKSNPMLHRFAPPFFVTFAKFRLGQNLSQRSTFAYCGGECHDRHNIDTSAVCRADKTAPWQILGDNKSLHESRRNFGR